MASLSLIDIAADIAKNAAIVTDFLKELGHVQPDFAVESPSRYPADAPPAVVAARSQLVHDARQLQFLALGPFESLQWYALAGVSIWRL